MVSQQIKSVGLTFNVDVPATVEEFTSLGGDPLKEANNNVLYRSYLADFRDRFVERLSAETSIKRKTKPGNAKKDGSLGQDLWAESPQKFIDRVLAETETEIEDYEGLVSVVQQGGYTPEGEKEPVKPLVFDPKASEGGEAGPKVPAKTYLVAADAVIAAGNADKVAANIGKILGREVATDRESIAAAIRDAEALERKQLANKYA